MASGSKDWQMCDYASPKWNKGDFILGFDHLLASPGLPDATYPFIIDFPAISDAEI